MPNNYKNIIEMMKMILLFIFVLPTTRMVECKDNFKNRYKDTDLLCPLCLVANDTQQHPLDCKVLCERVNTKKVSL